MTGIPPYGTGRRDLTRLDEQRAAAPETTPGQAAYELPAIDMHPDDLAEGWIAATYEPDDSSVGVGYRHEDMLAIHRAGWDHARALTAEALAAQERPAPEPVLHQLSGLIAGWRQAVDAIEYGRFADDSANQAEMETLREVICQVAEVVENGASQADAAKAKLRETAADNIALRALLAVAEAERNDLRHALDERNRQLDAFTQVVHDVTDSPALFQLAAHVREQAGMTVIDQFSKPAKP